MAAYWKCLVLLSCLALVTSQDGTRQEKRRRVRPEESRVDTSADHVLGNQTSPAELVLAQRGSGDGGHVISLLQRLGERLTSLHTLMEQQTRRLEGIEYRLTRLEVQGTERGDALRAVMTETTNHVQTLTYQSGQVAAGVEALRQGEQRQLSPDLPARLQGLGNSVQSMKGTVTSLQEHTATLVHNITNLVNITKYLRDGQSQLLSRHWFTSALAELRYSALPSISAPFPTQASTEQLPADCAAVKQAGFNESGIYRIQPWPGTRPFFALCELNARGGGWTVIQNRFEGGIDFYRDWVDYKHGFGNLGGEFWLGLDKIHQLTSTKVSELVIEIQDFTLDSAYAHYAAFGVGSEVEGYPLAFLAGYEGDAGDSLVYHAGMKFSTRDADHDQWPDGNCAETHLGGWWYNGCDTSNLNGRYLNGALPESHESQGMYWYDWRGPSYSLMRSRLMVRPKSHSVALHDKQTEKRNKEQDTKIKRGPGASPANKRTTTQELMQTSTTESSS